MSQSWKLPAVVLMVVIVCQARLAAQHRPPLEGPLTRVVLSLTDDSAYDGLEFVVTYRPALSGSVLPAAAPGPVLAVLDSGGATHLLGHQDSVELGLDGDFRTGNQFQIGGANGSIDVDLSQPLGLFVHGVQDLGPGGLAQDGRMVGQGNCPLAVNTEANESAGNVLPSVVGLPILAFYPVEVRNSEVRKLRYRGERIRSAAATFYEGAADPALPSYPHRVPLEYAPPGDTTVVWLFDIDFETFEFTPASPAIAGNGGLLRTASSSLLLTETERDRTVQLVLDTGAQATLISENVAIDLGLDLASPEFEVEVQGIGGVEMAPGYHLDRMDLPTGAGGLSWTEVPVVVRNVTGPEGTVIDGILGSNLLGDRDYLINAATTAPYLEISATRMVPQPEITAIRRSADGTVEVDWECHPGAPEILLETSGSPASEPAGWSVVASSELASLGGTLGVASPSPSAYFRIRAVTE